MISHRNPYQTNILFQLAKYPYSFAFRNKNTSTILDSKNALIIQKNKRASDQRIAIPLSNLENGVYVIKLTNSQGKYLQGRFVIQR